MSETEPRISTSRSASGFGRGKRGASASASASWARRWPGRSVAADRAVFVAFHEHGVQRPVEVVAAGGARGFDRRDGVHGGAGTDLHAGCAQGAGEADDLLGEAQLAGVRPDHSAAFSSISDCLISPSTRGRSSLAMSS
jgi:hypothetical protein